MKKRIILFSVFGALLAVWGCSKFKVEKFVAPSWDTQFAAPLFDRTYSLYEIFYKDSTSVSGGDTTFLHLSPSTNVYTISRTQAIKGIPVGDNLKISGSPSFSAAQSPGNFTIQSPDSINYTVPYPNGLTRGTVLNPVVPAIPATTVDQTPNTQFAKYNTATISNGKLRVTIHNGYPATVTFANGSINIVDASTGNPIPLNINSIGPNGTFDSTYSLNNHTLTNKPTIHFIYSSPGANNSATLQSDNLLTIFMGFTTLTVSSANAIVPPQPPIYVNVAAKMGSETEVDSANVSSGGINLTLGNDFNMDLPVTLVFKDIFSQNNPTDTLKKQYVLPAHGNPPLPTQFIDLTGYQLRMIDKSGNPGDSLHMQVIINGMNSNNQYVDISSQDSVRTTFNMNGLAFSSFTGVIHPTNTFQIASDTQAIDLGDIGKKITGGLTFNGDETKLNLKIRSFGLPYYVHLALKPTSENSSSAPLDSAVVDTIIYPGPNQVAIGAEFASALNSFAIREQKIPDRFIISGYAKVNPLPSDPILRVSYAPGWFPTPPGTISDTDKISITNTISMPLDIGIINASYIDTTKKALITDSATTAKMGNVDSGEVHFDIWNGLPLNLAFVPELIDTLDGSITPLDSIVISAPTQFDANGVAIQPVFCPNKIKLTTDQAEKFGRSYMRFNIRVSTANGTTPVPFSKNNTIRLKVYANLAFRVDKTLTGGK
jgi:hypothetical protein